MKASALIFVPVLLILALFALIPLAGIAGEGVVGGIELTNHARTSHSQQTWNAVSIQEYFAQGKCIPQEYSCVAKDFDVQYCEIKPGLSIGLIIGRTVKQVVSGYASRTSYWQSRCK